MCFTACTTARVEEGQEGEEATKRQRQKCYAQLAHQETLLEHLRGRVW